MPLPRRFAKNRRTRALSLADLPFAQMVQSLQALEASPEDRQAYMSVKTGECTRNCDATELEARADSLHRVPLSFIHTFLQRAVRRLH